MMLFSDDAVPREGAHILTQICRINTAPSMETADLDIIINKNMQLMCFKLRKYKSCFLSNIRFVFLKNFTIIYGASREGVQTVFWPLILPLEFAKC